MNVDRTDFTTLPAVSHVDGGAPSRRRSRWVAAGVLLWHNKLALIGVLFLLILGVLILVEPFLPLPSATDIDLTQVFASPSRQHLLGTDENGRDVFVRLIRGGRVSLAVGLAGAVLTVLIGTLLGLPAGYFGGAIEQLVMRFTDGLMSIPVFFLVLAVVAILGSTPVILISVLAATRWMGVARLVRSEVLRHRSMEFVMAARSIGASDARIMFRHLLPQAGASIIVATSIGVGSIMLVEAALSFLGLGISPPTPSWGNMLSNSQYYIWSAPHLAVYPGLMILMSVLAFNSIGDLLRDVLDPRYTTIG